MVFDADFVYGENFFIFTTEEDKTQWLLNQQISAAEARAAAKGAKKKKAAVGADGADATQDDDEDDDEEDDDEDAEAVARAKRPATWQSLGSELDIDAASWRFSRPPIRLLISRRRRYFGARVVLSDRVYPSNPDADDAEGGADDNDGVAKPLNPDAIEYRAIVPEEGEASPALVYVSPFREKRSCGFSISILSLLFLCYVMSLRLINVSVDAFSGTVSVWTLQRKPSQLQSPPRHRANGDPNETARCSTRRAHARLQVQALVPQAQPTRPRRTPRMRRIHSLHSSLPYWHRLRCVVLYHPSVNMIFLNFPYTRCFLATTPLCLCAHCSCELVRAPFRHKPAPMRELRDIFMCYA